MTSFVWKEVHVPSLSIRPSGSAVLPPDFASQLVGAMNFLIVGQGFRVVDLFTGRLLLAEDIPDLPRLGST